MYTKPLIAVILVMALVTMACGVTINLPVEQVKTGPMETTDITVPLPENDTTVTDVSLAFGAGKIVINPGAENDLVTGTATYNVPDFRPEVKITGNTVRIEQGNLQINGIPNFQGNIQNDWDLSIGSTPINLSIDAGAYSGSYELGGLSLNRLDVTDGASDVALSFSEPNQSEMSTLSYKTGASNVHMDGLSNANFSVMTFRSGAGSYTLDFSGELQRDADVNIDTGISSLTIIVPEGTAAEVHFTGALSNVTTSGAWSRSSGKYVMSGEGPKITISIQMGAGSLDLRDK